jgi:hypothetical protein
MSSPSLGPAQLDCSMSRLFSQLVSLQLAQIMHSDDDSGWPFETCSPALGLLERRLDSLEKNQHDMIALLQNLISRLPQNVVVGVPVPGSPAPAPEVSQFYSAQFTVDPNTSAYVAPSSSQLFPNTNTFANAVPSSAQLFPVNPNTSAIMNPSSAPLFAVVPSNTFGNMAPSAPDAAVDSSGSGGSSGNHSSPDGFLFVCSLCMRPQHTPKTHCEHMRRMAEGVGQCSLSHPPQLLPDRHKRILAVFGSASRFVTWFVLFVSACALCSYAFFRYCRHLRSGTAREYTPQDVADYQTLQRNLDIVLTAGEQVIVVE